MNKANHSAEHSALVDAVLLALGSRTDCRVWKQARVVAQNGHTGNVIDVGIKGMFDVTGVASDGRRIEIECKTGRGRLSEDQKVWLAMCDRFHVIAGVARSPEDAVALFETAMGLRSAA